MEKENNKTHTHTHTERANDESYIRKGKKQNAKLIHINTYQCKQYIHSHAHFTFP